MKINKKGLIIVLIIVISIVGYLASSQKSNNLNNVEPLSTATSSQTDISNWKIYTNDYYGLEFKYPNDWKINLTNNTTNGVIVLSSPAMSIDKYDITFAIDNSINFDQLGINMKKSVFNGINDFEGNYSSNSESVKIIHIVNNLNNIYISTPFPLPSKDQDIIMSIMSTVKTKTASVKY